MLLACLLPPHDTAAVPAVCASAVTLSDLCLCSSCCAHTHTHAHTFLTPCSHTAIMISHQSCYSHTHLQAAQLSITRH